jgi:hypothetical protein
MNKTREEQRISRRELLKTTSLLTGSTFLPFEIEAAANAASSGATQPKEWHELGDLFAMAYLVFLRDWLRNSNLYDTEDPPLMPTTESVPMDKKYARTFDGTWNDLTYPTMGSVKRRFGRNVPLNMTFPEADLLDPNPRHVSVQLMTRDNFKPACSINLLAAAWIQFQVHDWFAHFPDTNDVHKVPLPQGDNWPHGDPIVFPKTMTDGQPDQKGPPAYANQNSHWWDGSQLYGNDVDTNKRLRTGQDGKIKVCPNGLLELDQYGEEITGFLPNGWIGVSMLHGLFALEHNAICDRLKQKHPLWSDEELHQKARLIVAALLAKIHTLEWTPAALQTDVLKIAMSTNWRGLLGKLQQLSDAFNDSELLGGIMGSTTDHHTAPYALTEEFVSVYRMHPLMPDTFTFRSAADGSELYACELPDVAGKAGRLVLERFQDNLHHLFYSLGIAHPGAITLQNYPKHLQNLRRSDGSYVDLATLEIVRDRERGIPRYNALRRMLGKRPVRTFEELTPGTNLAAKLKDIYKDVDRVDTMVGLLAEAPPKNFAFSDTAFRIFILMASRRLKSDRFFTTYWTKDTYTKTGLDWIEDNSMATVLRRHFPKLTSRIGKHANAFLPWHEV